MSPGFTPSETYIRIHCTMIRVGRISGESRSLMVKCTYLPARTHPIIIEHAHETLAIGERAFEQA